VASSFFFTNYPKVTGFANYCSGNRKLKDEYGEFSIRGVLASLAGVIIAILIIKSKW
jgi:hypothetical protein